MKALILTVLLMSSSVCFSAINDSKDVSIRGTLISAYYQKLASDELSFYFNIKTDSMGHHEYVKFTGDDIKLALPFVSALGKNIYVANDAARFTIQVIEPVE